MKAAYLKARRSFLVGIGHLILFMIFASPTACILTMVIWAIWGILQLNK